MTAGRAVSRAPFLTQAAIWGSSFTLIKLALVDLDASLIVIARLVLGAVVLVLVAVTTRAPLRVRPRVWLHVAISSVFANVLPYLLLTVAEGTVSAGIAGVLVGATPVLTLVFARVALRDAGRWGRRGVGFLLALLGVVAVAAPWSSPLGSLAGAGGCFLAAASYAVGYVYVRRFVTPAGVAPVSLAAHQLIAAAVIMVPIAGVSARWPVGGVGIPAVVAVMLLGALSTGLANVLYFRLIRDIGAAGAAAVDYVVPVFAVLFGAFLLGEAITWNVVLGGLVILVGMGIAEGRLSQCRRTPG